MQIISKHRHRALGIALVSGATCILMFWLVLRRAGFNTPYSRCTYLVMLGDYRQMLRPGTTPSNPMLPPHLRLDQRSYLDLAATELAVPPELDVSLTPVDVIKGLEHQLPRTERSDLHCQFGPFATQTIILSPRANERYVQRRLGVTEEDRETRAAADAAAAETLHNSRASA